MINVIIVTVRHSFNKFLIMASLKAYARNEFRTEMLRLEHKCSSDFYIACFQRTYSVIPLLLIRAVLFVGSLSVLFASFFMLGSTTLYGLWFIYLTNWGLMLLTATAAYGLLLSIHAYTGQYIDDLDDLSWSLKTYWVLYNVTVPIALLITTFYWGLLRNSDFMKGKEPLIPPTLDYLIHGANSALALLMVATAQTPSRLMHFYQPMALALGYLLFSVAFYVTGGHDPLGHSWIYPMLDWSRPLTALLTATLTGVLLVMLHATVVAAAHLRDAITHHCTKNRHSVYYVENT